VPKLHCFFVPLQGIALQSTLAYFCALHETKKTGENLSATEKEKHQK